jgi:hypothetical protein
MNYLDLFFGNDESRSDFGERNPGVDRRRVVGEKVGGL